MPIGNLTSQIFANIYLNEFDQFVKHILKVKNYARYTDDFVIISEDSNYLSRLLLPIQQFLKDKLLLELHPKKITIRKCRQGIDFLGYVILPYHILLRAKTRKRIFRKLKRKIAVYKSGVVSEASLFASLQSYFGVLSHANAYRLREQLHNQLWLLLNE